MKDLQKGVRNMGDKRIIDLFFARSEAAIAESEKKYGKYLRFIAFSVLGDESDCEKIENDTYLRAWNSIPPENPSSLKGYLAALCRNLSCNRYKAKKAQKRGEPELALDELGECIADSSQESDLTDRLALRHAIETFLRSLETRTRIIFLQRYFYTCPVAEIASRHGMKESAVTMLLFRTRKKLKEHLQKEGIEL